MPGPCPIPGRGGLAHAPDRAGPGRAGPGRAGPGRAGPGRAGRPPYPRLLMITHDYQSVSVPLGTAKKHDLQKGTQKYTK